MRPLWLLGVVVLCPISAPSLPLLFPVLSRDRAVGDSPKGSRPAPMAERDGESGSSVGKSGRASPGPG